MSFQLKLVLHQVAPSLPFSLRVIEKNCLKLFKRRKKLCNPLMGKSSVSCVQFSYKSVKGCVGIFFLFINISLATCHLQLLNLQYHELCVSMGYNSRPRALDGQGIKSQLLPTLPVGVFGQRTLNASPTYLKYESDIESA